MSFDEVCRQLFVIGGIDRCGQSAFCLLFVIYMKAYELGSFSYTITNKELMYKAGFATRQNYLKVRNGLESEGYIDIEATENKRIIKIELNADIIGLSVDSQMTNSIQGANDREKLISVDKEFTESCQNVDKQLTKSLQQDNGREKVKLVDKELTERSQRVDSQLSDGLQEDDNPLQGLIKTFTRS